MQTGTPLAVLNREPELRRAHKPNRERLGTASGWSIWRTFVIRSNASILRLRLRFQSPSRRDFQPSTPPNPITNSHRAIKSAFLGDARHGNWGLSS